jgi:hypothetical protein
MSSTSTGASGTPPSVGLLEHERVVGTPKPAELSAEMRTQ